MNIVGYIILAICILFVLMIYALFLFGYIISSKNYRAAARTNATVIEILDEIKYATGEHSVGNVRYRKFQKYKVSLCIDGKEFIQEAELKNKKLAVGDIVEVRYDYDKKGKLYLESQALLCWLREMALGYTLGIIVGIVLSILKWKDLI